MPDYRHGVVALVPPNLHDVPSLTGDDDGGVRTAAGRVDAQHDGCGGIFVLGSLRSLVGQVRADELIVPGAGKLPVDLDAGLWAVLTVFSNDLVVDRTVGALNAARVDAAR